MKKLLIIIGVTVGLNTSIVAGPIHSFAGAGDLARVQAELDKGVDVNSKDGNEQTPLHLASRGGRREIVELLINNGADVNAKDKWEGTPLHSAAILGDKQIVELLIEKGANVDEKRVDGTTPLWFAASQNRKEISWLLIDKGADIEAKDGDRGRTPLHRAVATNSKETVDLLIYKGADINAKDNEGNSPLHIRLNDKEFAELLIGKGADVTALNNSGESVLWEQQRTEIIEYLIGEGVNVNAKDKHGKSIVDLWERDAFDNGEMAAFLRTHGGRSIVDELHYSVKDLNERVTALEKPSTNPTDEWPRKMWEIDLEFNVSSISEPVQGEDKAIFVRSNRGTANNDMGYWIRSDGSYYEIYNKRVFPGNIMYLDGKNLIVEDKESVTRFNWIKSEVVKSTYNHSSKQTDAGHNHELAPAWRTIQVSWEGTKITGWDFTPPSSTAPKPDGGNNGGNETVNSRLIIKTAGPDISLATDGKLGAAELQKSNDLRSWRKLSDVPKEAAEVLVTPRESGNEFYRLKKK
jgi:ankyrin repeat protein